MIDFRPPTPEDQAELIANMRDSDRQEIWMINRNLPADIVPAAVDISNACWAMRLRDGPLLCIFGAARNPAAHDEASIWELGTDEIERHPRLFIEGCRTGLFMIETFLPDVDVFFNYIPSDYARYRRWLEYLGATFGEIQTTINGTMIRGFAFVRKDHHV